MNPPPLEPQLEAEAEALVDDVFAHLEEPLPPRCLPCASQPLALVRPLPDTGAMVVLARHPAPLVPVNPPLYNPETILTAAFVDTPTPRPTPWWLWLGLATLVMVATWQWRHQWTSSAPAEPTHPEFIAYLERALSQIPQASPTPAPTGTNPPGITALPPPPPVTVMPIPPAPVITAPLTLPPSPTALAPTVKPAPRTAVTLIGLLQMGEGSVAMFQVGDTTQQVSVGGQVGQSGWQVKEVREQEVVLVRAGQNRTLIVGQAVGE